MSVGAMSDLPLHADGSSDRPGVAAMAIRRQAGRFSPCHSRGRLKKGDGGRHIPGLAQPGVDQTPRPVNGSIQVALPAPDLHVGSSTFQDRPMHAPPPRRCLRAVIMDGVIFASQARTAS